MLRKYKCGTCGRSYVNIEAHMGKRHGITHTLVDPIEGATQERPDSFGRPRDTTTNTGYAVKTSHNTPNPDAPPPSYAPATSHKETP